MANNWNCDQKQHIIKFMVKHGTGRSRLDINQWNELTDQLNSMGPPIKELNTWRKSWVDFKYTTRKKMLAAPPATKRQRKLSTLFSQQQDRWLDGISPGQKNRLGKDNQPRHHQQDRIDTDEVDILLRSPTKRAVKAATSTPAAVPQSSSSLLGTTIAEYTLGDDGVLDDVSSCKAEPFDDDPLGPIDDDGLDEDDTTATSSVNRRRSSIALEPALPVNNGTAHNGANTAKSTPQEASHIEQCTSEAGSSRPKSNGKSEANPIIESLQNKILHSLEKNTLKRERNQLLKEQNELLRKMHYSTESYRREMLAQTKEATDIQRRKLALMEKEAQRRSDSNYF